MNFHDENVPSFSVHSEMTSRKVVSRPICDILSSDRFKVFLLFLVLTAVICSVLWNHEKRLIIDKRDEKIVKEFLEFLENRRREDALRNTKALQIRMDDLDALYRQIPNVVDYFPIPRNIFSNKWLGQGGFPVKMPKNLPKKVQSVIDEGYRVHKFNQYLSDIISITRTLPDKRSSQCLKNRYKYKKRLPTTSIIIIFHNEAWSTLLRTVHSIMSRTPKSLINEIILVDDASTIGKLYVHE